jgi:hypothetical protein
MRLISWYKAMNDQELVADFRELYRAYKEGLSKYSELVAESMALLGHGNADLWDALPEDIRVQIEQIALSFSEEDEVISFGARTHEEMKQDLLGLKRWLMKRKGLT